MGLNAASVGTNPATANDTGSNWCEEQDDLGSNDHGTPGAVSGVLVGGGGC
jgi:hypothetical protein